MPEEGREQLEPHKLTYSKEAFANVDKRLKAARAKSSPNTSVADLEAAIKLEITRNALLDQAYQDALKDNEHIDTKARQDGQPTIKPYSWLSSKAREFGKGFVKGFTDPFSLFGKSIDASSTQQPKNENKKQ